MRLQVRPAPAVAIPLVIVARLAADIDHAIQRTRSAERLAAHPIFGLIMAAGLLRDIDMGQLRIRQRPAETRSEEHTSELQSLMLISYAVFCLKKKKTNTQKNTIN